MSTQQPVTTETSSPGCAEIFAFGLTLVFLLASGFLMAQAFVSLRQGETFLFLCLTPFAFVFAGGSLYVASRVVKNAFISYTVEMDNNTGAMRITGKLFGKIISTKTGSPPQKIELNLGAPKLSYPPGFVALHHATRTGLAKSGGMKWDRYLASLMEAPLAVLAALKVIDFYQIVFKEENMMGKSGTTFEYYARPGPRSNLSIDALLERHIIEIVHGWDASQFPPGVPLHTLVSDLFSRHFPNGDTHMLMAMMQDAKKRGLGRARRLGTLWQTSPEYAGVLDADSAEFERFMHSLQARHPALASALKEKTFQGIPRHDSVDSGDIGSVGWQKQVIN